MACLHPVVVGESGLLHGGELGHAAVTEALVFMSISSGPLGLMGTEVYPGQRPDTE